MPFVLESADFITREASRGQVMLDNPASALGHQGPRGPDPRCGDDPRGIILQWYPCASYLEVQQQVLDRAQKHAQHLARPAPPALPSNESREEASGNPQCLPGSLRFLS